MGQYYKTITKGQNNRITVYSRDVIRNGKRDYTMAKLLEHSWWYNDYVNAVCLNIYEAKPTVRVAWVGDYADDFLRCNNLESFNGLNKEQINRLHHRCWKEEGIAVYPEQFTLENRFLVNFTKKQYIDCSKYHKNSILKSDENGDWCIHPLPILTCLGNGMGGGDYTFATDDSNTELVGTWAWDYIGIIDGPIEDFTEIAPIFKEIGWED